MWPFDDDLNLLQFQNRSPNDIDYSQIVYSSPKV